MLCPWCNENNLPGSDLCGNCLQDLAPLDHPVAHDRVEHSLMNDPVSLLQPRPAVVVLPDATVEEAIHLMLARNIGAVLVVNVQGELLGIFSERDLLTKVAGLEAPTTCAVRDFMTRGPETVRETDSLAFALHKMDCGDYRHLPVLRDGTLIGVISVRDLLRHVTRICQPI
jgi:CBS domain-containing protein